MRVTLNCHRDGHGPGEVVDLPDGETASLLHFGAAHRTEDEPTPEPPADAAASPRSDASNDASSTKASPAAPTTTVAAQGAGKPGEASA